ncbi:microprocessor complex subunit DGCR8-like [Acanthaster planci]|uniref:Microprocessor complex subunit DGCR8-like n=1 Tax=Acanthaster planci TaxID=133434 RepID=A0A8B7XZH8_ACAPL|nr:microprocessor complex subunit DGCR8-like [Acanthaster planci]
MDSNMDERDIEPPSKKSKLESQHVRATEVDISGPWFRDMPFGETSGIQPHLFHGTGTESLTVEGSTHHTNFQVLDEFVTDDFDDQEDEDDLSKEDNEDGFSLDKTFEDEVENEEEGDDTDSLGSEIEALLDEGLPEMYNKEPKRKRGLAAEADTEASKEIDPSLPEGVVGVRTKTILRRRGQTPLEGLPDGWISIIHECGMPLYLHRPSRVCTWSRPYLLGAGSARKHRPPLASIPCLHYRREKDKETASQQDSKQGAAVGVPDINKEIANDQPQADPADCKDGKNSLAEVKRRDPLQSHNIHICKDESVSDTEMKEYLERLFDFEVVSINKFKTWADRRKYTKEVKAKHETIHRPQFPGHPAVITCKIPGNQRDGKKEFVLNTTNKTPVCILHEYAQIVLKTQPTYTFDDSGNANCPFQAYVVIHGTKYGKGQAKSKKEAKMEAARATLEILIPGVVLNDVTKKTGKDQELDQLEYFDHVSITDSRVYDLCTKSGQLTPFQVLGEYRQRNHGMEAMNFNYQVNITNHHKREYTMTLGEHTVTGFCKNKKVGKQQGAQQLLQLLHSHVDNWGGIIKIYGKGTVSRNMKKKEAEQSIIRLQAKCENAPNEAILNKLREEMLSFYDRNKEEAGDAEREANQNTGEMTAFQMPSLLSE